MRRGEKLQYPCTVMAEDSRNYVNFGRENGYGTHENDIYQIGTVSFWQYREQQEFYFKY